MKIIHAADIHLGSKLDSKFSKTISDQRKVEVRNTFKRLVEYANKNSISLIMLSGDIFDSNTPVKKDKDFFYNVIKNNPNITFLYLKGNHDVSNTNVETYDNLKVFSSSWQSYQFNNIVISGIELDDSNMSSFYSTLTLNENNVNIVMLHGQTGSSNKDINLLKLRNKNIDYLALGHIHSYSTGKIDDRAIYVYSGCLEPRGFDELNEKGFVEIEIIDNKLTHKFVSFSQRVIKEEQVDISLMDEAYDISEKIKKEININLNNIYRFKLIGETDIDVSDMLEDIEQYLKDQAYFINVVDKTSKVFDIHKYDYDLSLKGEFVRTVYQNEDYTEEEKIKIISLGLKALDKKGVE